jgi:acetyl-CoA C-acetyltransferase
MKKVYIVDAKRTAIGSMLGTLKDRTPGEIGSVVVKNILETTKLDPSKVDELICGNILMAGQKQGVARQVELLSGIPHDVPAYGVNMICGSGMKAVMNAYCDIQANFADVVIAGGTEVMSNTPFLVPSASRSGLKMGNFAVVDHMINDALTDAFTGVHMGITAENIVNKYGITRAEQDEFAINSQAKAIAAVDSGAFKDEIVPVVIKTRKEEIVFDTDEYPNRKTSLEKLGTLRPAFVKDGSVTAGNASGINDGAAFLMVASEDAVKENNLKPLVEIVAIGQGGVDPQVMGLGPVPAIRNVLKNAGLKLSDMEIIELNEAFAAQSLGVIHELIEEHGVTKEWIMERTNVTGGAIALGHPVGASGARIIVTLIHNMLKSGKKLGLASLCIGGGMGTAIIVKLI